MGRRRQTLWRAAKMLTTLAADGRVRCSDIIDSEPWGYDSGNRYLNIGVAFETDLTPHALLQATQHIERQCGATAHRAPDGSYLDRTLDIDIIAVDNLHIDTPELTLPHPRMHLREFVLAPLRQLGYPYI